VGRCGDGAVQTEYDEECDLENLNSATCVSLGYSQGSGALACLEMCEFDETLCVPRSANAELVALGVDQGQIIPAFSASIRSYSVTVLLSVETMTVTATAADPWATVTFSPAQPMSLVVGQNPVTVTVTAEDGTQEITTLMVNRQATLNYESPNVGTMIYVPAGIFQRDPTPQNLSAVSAFRMSRNEITRAQWTAVTGWADPSIVAYSSGQNDPVQMVNSYHAMAFCNKLSLLEGLTPVYSVSGVDFTTLTFEEIPVDNDPTWDAATADWNSDGYRLPTDMEWLWAAMGADLAAPGAVNTTGYTKLFPGDTGSNFIGDYAVYGYNDGVDAGRTTTERSNPVGSKLPNELGFYDLGGNVFEWLWDWYNTYPLGLLTDYRGSTTTLYRLLRGGNWRHSQLACRLLLANATIYWPSSRTDLTGFRVVRL